VDNPVSVRCDSANTTAVRLQNMGYTNYQQGGVLFGDTPQAVSASFLINPNSTCDITQETDGEAYYKSCGDVEDCSLSDQCLTFHTDFDFEVLDPTNTGRPSPAAAIWIRYNAKVSKNMLMSSLLSFWSLTV
jgi:hypothetical protein